MRAVRGSLGGRNARGGKSTALVLLFNLLWIFGHQIAQWNRNSCWIPSLVTITGMCHHCFRCTETKELSRCHICPHWWNRVPSSYHDSLSFRQWGQIWRHENFLISVSRQNEVRPCYTVTGAAYGMNFVSAELFSGGNNWNSDHVERNTHNMYLTTASAALLALHAHFHWDRRMFIPDKKTESYCLLKTQDQFSHFCNRKMPPHEPSTMPDQCECGKYSGNVDDIRPLFAKYIHTCLQVILSSNFSEHNLLYALKI